MLYIHHLSIVLKKSFYTILKYSNERKFPDKLIQITLVNKGQVITL